MTLRQVRLVAPAAQRHRTRLLALRHGFAAGEPSLEEVRTRVVAFGAHAEHGDTGRLLRGDMGRRHVVRQGMGWPRLG